jgi:O-antigen ligase
VRLRAFAGGAVSLPEETWLQAGIVVLAVAAAVAWLGPGALRPAASPWALLGLGLLVAFAVWTGASLLWSVAPDRTWQQLNRVLMYALVVAVALAARARRRGRSSGWPWAGWSSPPRSRSTRWPARSRPASSTTPPTWPGCARRWSTGTRSGWCACSACRRRSAWPPRPTLRGAWRIAAVLALLLLVCCLGMTYSRGGIVALVVALAVVVVTGRAKLPALAVFALVAAAAAPVLAFAWTEDALTAGRAPLAEQIDAGLKLGGVLACAAVLAGVGAWALLGLERRVVWPPGRSRTVWLGLGVVLLALVAGGIAAAASSERGLRGTIEKAADDFTEPTRDPTFEPGRLLTTSSANRWSWWREAGGAFADEPVLGWGGGSFGISRRLYRVAPDDVRQPHSTPMQFLAEVGVVGAVLGLGALLALLWAAVQRVRARTDSDLAGALLAAAAAWFVHALIDWDWDIPGVTVPALVFLGVLGARSAAPRTPAFAGADDHGGPGRPSRSPRRACWPPRSSPRRCFRRCRTRGRPGLPRRRDRNPSVWRTPRPTPSSPRGWIRTRCVPVRRRRGGRGPRPPARGAPVPARRRRAPALERRGVDAPVADRDPARRPRGRRARGGRGARARPRQRRDRRVRAACPGHPRAGRGPRRPRRPRRCPRGRDGAAPAPTAPPPGAPAPEPLPEVAPPTSPGR